MKLIDCNPEAIEAVLRAAEQAFALPTISAQDLGTEAGRLHYAEAIGRHSTIDTLRAALQGAIKSNKQSSPSTSP